MTIILKFQAKESPNWQISLMKKRKREPGKWQNKERLGNKDLRPVRKGK